MDALAAPTIEAGDGTPEPEWRRWLQARALPPLAPTAVVAPGQRVVVVAPHPDDEILMVGGLLSQLSALRRTVVVVAVTDGEASHPGSTRWTPARLARQRQRETLAALTRLGCRAEVRRAALPDGAVAAHADALQALLARLLRPSDVVFTTWSGDGHPDHEATGRATRGAAMGAGARLYEVPVWGWHWAAPGAAQMPWAAAVAVPLSAQAVRRKCAAVRAFVSQWDRDATCAQAPILRTSTYLRAQRPFEVLFG